MRIIFLQHCQIWKLKVSKAKSVRVAFLLFMLVACKNVIIIYITIYDSSITLHLYTCINSSSLNRTTTAKDIQNRCVWSNDGDIFIDSYDRHRVCKKVHRQYFIYTHVEEWSDWRDIIICHLFACVIWFPFFVCYYFAIY